MKSPSIRTFMHKISREKGFRYLPHTADAKFQAFGKTFEEALANAGRATTNLITDVSAISPTLERRVELRFKNYEDLVIDFLEELLYLLEVDVFLMCDADVEIKDGSLRGTFHGDFVKNYKTHGHVKAITYHDLKVEKTDKGFMIQVVVDM